MKMYLWLLIIPFVLSCGPTKNAIIAEQAYYSAMKEIALAQKPLLDIKIADPTKPINVERIIVNTQNAQEYLKQYTQKDYAQPWINAFLQSLGILAPWAGAAVIVGQIANMPHVAGPSTNTNVTASGGSQAMTGGTMSNATATPTVITQPAPIVITVP